MMTCQSVHIGCSGHYEYGVTVLSLVHKGVFLRIMDKLRGISELQGRGIKSKT